ncbi:MAG: carboxypeptidase regulatory-like domain-containing protein [Acidobacteria bacterium]|nr:carboxypeptidase regulatory-like domain-containing protein [Acidobacteriota bacterium]
MKRFLIILIAFYLCGAFAFASAADASRLLARAAKVFGPPLDAELHLYPVGRHHVLRVDLDPAGNLLELRVEDLGNYFETHPEWEATEGYQPLTQSDFRSLLDRLDRIQTKGRVVRPASLPFAVEYRTEYMQETYERARLRWARMVDLDTDRNQRTVSVLSIQVIFDHRGKNPVNLCPCRCRPAASDHFSNGGNEFILLDLPVPRHRVFGRISLPDGKSAADAMVEIFECPANEYGLSHLDRETKRIAACHVEEDGYFCLDGLPPGNYVFRAGTAYESDLNQIHAFITIAGDEEDAFDEPIFTCLSAAT